MPKQNVPALRLDGFSGEWETVPLNTFTERVQRKNTDLQSTLPLTISAQYGLVDQITYFNNRVASANLRNYLLVENGEFAYNKSFSAGHPVGTVKRLDKYDRGVLSSLYIVFRLLEHPPIDGDFLLTFFETSSWHRFVEANSAEGARNHGLLNISAQDFLEVPVTLAPTLEEQQAIGAIFTNLDAAINQHMLKHKALQQSKTALMQRMFPQEGQTVPELRLEGFSGEWEETTLGELGTFRSGVGFPEREQGGTIGLPFYKVSDLSAPGNELQLQSANHYVTEGQIVRNHWTPVTAVPAILFAKVGAAVFLGRKRLVNNAFLLDNNLMAFSLNTESWDVQFADTYLKTVDLTQFTQSGALPSLNARHLAEAEAIIPPTLEEQQAIGAIFTKLDQLIAAEAQYIESFKQAKTALLQRMFI